MLPRKLFLLLFMVVCFAADGFPTGIKLGPVFGFASGSGSSQQGAARKSLAVEIFTQTQLGRWTIQPGMRYSPLGGRATDLLGVTGLTGLAKLNYIEFPILVWFPSFSLPWLPRFFVGPSLGIAAGQSIELASLVDINLNNRFNSLNVALETGLGYFFRVSQNIEMVISAHFSWGLTNISEIPNQSYRNRFASLMTGITYHW